MKYKEYIINLSGIYREKDNKKYRSMKITDTTGKDIFTTDLYIF